MLRVRLLGELAVEADGERLTPPTGRPVALLGWLALNRGMHSRAAVASRFWPDILESSSRASLRSALWSLRAALGTDADRWLITRRDAVGLADAVGTDVAEFRSYAASGQLERAAETGAGELLAGLGDDWVFEAREEHARQLSSVLAALVAQSRERGCHDAAVEWAQRRVALDPLSEDAVRGLMQALAEDGDRSAALAAYATLRERFRLELGMSPAEPTRALRDEIRAAGRPPGDEGPLAAATYPLAGRSRELNALAGVWSAARKGRGAVVVITGEGGIGKTRLALELARRAHGEGATVATCAPLDLGGAAPFGLWAELLRDLTRALPDDPPPDAGWPSELARLTPEPARRLGRSPSPAGASPELERARLFEAMVEMVEWASQDRPLLLLLEDVHIADRASLELAGYIARSARRLPVLLVLTRRDLPRRPELDVLMTRLRAHSALALDLALAPLEDRAVAVLARAVAELRDDEIQRIVELADGNPLLATETARAGARGDLPASLREAARAALASLGEDARQLAALAAAAGRDLERDEVASLPLANRAASATEALESGLLVSTGTRVGYRHALLRDAVYADLPEPRRTELHEQIAAALSGSAAASAAEVARHLRIAGRDAEAVRHLVDAAAAARGVGALAEAAEFLEEALQFAPQDGALLLVLGEIEAWRGRVEASRAAFDRALASTPPADGLTRARVWLRRGRSFRGALCFPRESRTAYLEALTTLEPAHARERAEALAGLAWTEAVAGDVERVDPLLRELHRLVGREQPDSALALDIGLARGHALIRLGQFAESYPPLIAAAEAGARASRPDLSYTCWINASSAAACAGQFDRSLEFADRCRAWMRDAGLLALEANAISARTQILIRLARLPEALASAEEGRALAERLDSASLRATAAHDRGMVERALGNHAMAESLLADAISGDAAVSRPLARIARAESLACLGRADEAEEELRLTAFEPLGPSDFPDTLVARLTYVQALVADSRGDAGLARRRLEEAIGVWKRRTDRAGYGDDYMDVMVDLGRPPVAGLIEPQRELASLEAALDAMSARVA